MDIYEADIAGGVLLIMGIILNILGYSFLQDNVVMGVGMVLIFIGLFSFIIVRSKSGINNKTPNKERMES